MSWWSAVFHLAAASWWHLYFAPDVGTTLDQIELVFDWLKLFNLKVKPKKCYFFRPAWFFWVMSCQPSEKSANPKKVDKVRDWPVPKNTEELYSLLGLASYYCWFIPNFAHVAKCLHQLVGPTNIRKTKSKKVKKEVTTLEDKNQI